ncbi:hypothetical protein SAMN05443637_11416 [Pseudonocardia thermophila]|mgnify:CR=1 FL=1|uniref:DUF2087 domain-containing protein n=1 Tax=Pseudonocardia thermophila TaxID=1848 RepID=A0A1M6W8K7_PSETH|nr:DUF2087 domain-containing protein [Pseudonocardia thermophila]SHK89825.1 hypothetical protein SAMN05443637_11416 [Pseudonocardia thermophila]
MDAVALVGLLAEPVRLRVFAALVLGAKTPGAVADLTGLSARETVMAIARLQAGGLVDEHLVVREGLFTEAAMAAAPDEPVSADVVDRFVRGGRLVGLPAQESKRRLVLERVVQSFEPGRRFSEREVDAVLRVWTEGGATDHVTLRRHLVDHGLLTRGDGQYWRTGGWVDVLADA